jgi:hypothetical protein
METTTASKHHSNSIKRSNDQKIIRNISWSHAVEITGHCTRNNQESVVLRFGTCGLGNVVKLQCEADVKFRHCCQFPTSHTPAWTHPGFIEWTNVLGINPTELAKLIIKHSQLQPA